MDFIKDHKIEKSAEGYIVTLFVDQNYTEFANELGTEEAQSEQTNQNIKDYVKERYPRKKITSIKVFLGSILLMSFSLTTDSKAYAAEDPPNSSLEYKQNAGAHYKVEAGDTLFKIAQKNNTSVDVIKRLNNLRADTIYIGQVLQLPSTTNSTQSTASYQVKAGDTLSEIAKTHSTTVDQIKQANDLTTDKIYVGQTLQIPSLPQTEKQGDSHLVSAGDTLSGIAKRYQVSVEQIKQVNDLNSTTIYVGQTLTIPSGESSQEGPPPTSKDSYQVIAGDTLSEIAKKYNLKVDQIKEANNLTTNTIYVGQNLSIPGNHSQVEPPTSPESLAHGVESPEVKELQANLKQLGYFTDEVTGYFGSVTEQSVHSFQRAYGTSTTGVADRATQEEIEHALLKQRLVADTYNYQGVPYVWGGTSPAGFDCSGFIHYMFTTHGVDMSRTTSGALYHKGTEISRNQLQPGDLVFFAVNQPGVISHVGFYTGNNNFISATSSKGIWEYSMDNRYWSNYYVGAKRVY